MFVIIEWMFQNTNLPALSRIQICRTPVRRVNDLSWSNVYLRSIIRPFSHNTRHEKRRECKLSVHEPNESEYTVYTKHAREHKKGGKNSYKKQIKKKYTQEIEGQNQVNPGLVMSSFEILCT